MYYCFFQLCEKLCDCSLLSKGYCVLCDVIRDLLFSWYMVYQAKVLFIYQEKKNAKEKKTSYGCKDIG